MNTLFQARNSVFHRLHPLTKLIISLGLIVLGLGIGSPWAPLALYLGVLAPLSLIAQVGRPFALANLRVVLPFALSLFVIQSLFFPEGDTVLLQLGPLTVKAEGMLFAFVSTARILLIIGAVLLLLLTTHPGALMTALTQKGFPPALAYVIVTTLQIAPQLQARATTIIDAQRSRGLETQGSVMRRMGALVPLLGPLVLGSLLDVEERALALEARAFGARGARTSLFELRDPVAERVFRWSLVFVMVAIVGVRLVEVLR